jgi:hypothetical protein
VERMWFGPAPITQIFFFDSGIRLRQIENLAIAAGPHHIRPTNGPPRRSSKVELMNNQPSPVPAHR